MNALSFQLARLLACVAVLSCAGCKKEPSCKPDSVEWGVRLAFGASPSINLSENGEPLPTSMRVFQVRGETAIDDLDFDALWAAEKASDLGDAFLAVEQLTIYPDQPGTRSLPIETDATHILAAGLFRESVGNTWYTLYEIPLRHPDVVCAKAPTTKIYPDPCFYVYLDRASLSGGPTPPAGFVPDENVECAPLGAVAPPPEEEGRRGRRKRRKKPDLDDPLGTKDLEKDIPKTPDTPSLPSQPKAPSGPKVPDKPEAPSLPKG
ncbi:MAG: type VI secretion system lipoprotein TssJ [Nannocystaceae bacterium]|nr:type VI secretion system lipoprotein TssJ [Nannocystaceae bacterium]